MENFSTVYEVGLYSGHIQMDKVSFSEEQCGLNSSLKQNEARQGNAYSDADDFIKSLRLIYKLLPKKIK